VIVVQHPVALHRVQHVRERRDMSGVLVVAAQSDDDIAQRIAHADALRLAAAGVGWVLLPAADGSNVTSEAASVT
jgi:hypothetical protein